MSQGNLCIMCKTCHLVDYYFCQQCKKCFKHHDHCTLCHFDPHHIEKCICKLQKDGNVYLCPGKLDVPCNDCNKCHQRETKAKHPFEYEQWTCIANRFQDDMFYCKICNKCYNASKFNVVHPDHQAIIRTSESQQKCECYALGLSHFSDY